MKFKSKYLIYLFFSLLVFPFLVFIIFNTRDLVVDFFRPTTGLVNRFFSKPFHFVSDIVTDSRALFSTFEENKILKKELSDYQTLVSENNSLKSENVSLRESMELFERYQERKYITAEVISRLSSTWTSELVLSKGRQDGVTENMLVLANNGVVGTIISIEDDSSTVQLLSDDFYAPSIPVKIEGANPTYGILSDYDARNHVFRITQLNQTSGVEVGQTIVTSDFSESYPANIFIGTVSTVIDDKDKLGIEVLVTPSVDFSRIYNVILVGRDI
ncbi:rod shape-determining protein MreC [Streptococcus rifensis]